MFRFLGHGLICGDWVLSEVLGMETWTNEGLGLLFGYFPFLLKALRWTLG